MEEATRTVFHDALAKSPNQATRALAEVVVATPEGRVACWGDLVDYVREHFQSDDDSVALWKVLTDVGDRRPQLLFLDIHRARPAVLRSILADTSRVAPIVQCALVAMPEAAPLVANATENLAPAASELAAGSGDVRARERAVYESHMGSLRAQRAGAAFSQDAVLRHIEEAAPLLAAIAQPVTGAPQAPHPVPQPVIEAPQAPHLVPQPVIEAPQAPRRILEVPQALRPGGPQ